ncbi:hypothetical protein NL676_004416 [Syzygium grande]|nr:hypothetical protein NL676_004416 [Syzygium grande]
MTPITTPLDVAATGHCTDISAALFVSLDTTRGSCTSDDLCGDRYPARSRLIDLESDSTPVELVCLRGRERKCVATVVLGRRLSIDASGSYRRSGHMMYASMDQNYDVDRIM